MRNDARALAVMTAATLAISCSAWVAAQTPAVTGAPETRPMNLTWKDGPHAGQTFAYELHAPEHLEPAQRYPLVVYLHGAGERGTDSPRTLLHIGAPLLGIEGRRKFPCFVLAPQCPANEQWVEVPWDAAGSSPMADEPSFPIQLTIACLLRTVAENPIDLDRIYLTGISMGGFGAWELGLRHPTWFAAVAPICGGGDERLAHRLVGLPVSAYHGDSDRVVLPVRSRQMVDAMRAAGGDAKLTELPGVGHDSWVQAYGPDGVIPWMFTQRRAPDGGLAKALELLTGAKSPLRSPLKKGAKIAFLGDSITQSGAGPGGYVSLLSAAFAAQPSAEVEVIGAGVSGNRVPDLQERVQRDVIDRGATVVFVYIGINDVWHRLQGHGTPEDAYEAGLRDLVARLKKSGATVILATPSLIGEKTPGTNELDAPLDTYAAITRRVAADDQLHVCDLRRAFQDHERVFNTRSQPQGVLTTDGVHLNPAGNRLVAREAALALFETLR